MTGIQTMIRQLRNIARNQRGDTLIELLIVMVILLIVIGALADGFASATKAEVDQSNRSNDQQAARTALARMRLDIHCAYSAQPVSAIVDGSGNTTGYLLTLPQPSPGCPGVGTNGAAAVQWCTVKVTSTRYKLFRSIPDCTSNNPAFVTFEVDYITQANIWTNTTCAAAGEFPTVGVDMPVNRDPIKRASRTYELKDAIAIRNAAPC